MHGEPDADLPAMDAENSWDETVQKARTQLTGSYSPKERVAFISAELLPLAKSPGECSSRKLT